MPETAITVKPAASIMGAEITGAEIARLSERELQIIRDAVLRYAVVVVRDQHLTPDDQITFMDRLYGRRPLPSASPPFALPGHPEIVVVSNIVEDGKPIGISDAGLLWHTDTCFTANPEVFVSLYALEIPTRDGVALGDTRWTSTVSAYEALPELLKAELAGRKVCQSFPFHMDKLHSIGALTRPRDVTKVWPAPVMHPAVRTHPITGRKLLYVNESFSAHLEGLDPERSTVLLQELWAHLIQPRFGYQHSWRKNDFVVWDNCATQHLATFDYGTIPRRLHRCGTNGPVPV